MSLALSVLWLGAPGVLQIAAAAPSHKAHASANVIQNIVVEGNQRIETSTVLSYINIQKGDPFNQSLIDSSLKSLYATGLFADVSMHQDGHDLVIKVTENPLINEIRFEGNKKLKTDDLKSEIQLRARMVLTRTKVQADVERLQEIYRLSGRFSAVIDPQIIKLSQNRVNLIFKITEGPETLISRINFIGNRRFSADALKTIIRSREERWYRFWSHDDTYDQDRFAYDQELLRRFYLNHGYAGFHVRSAVAQLSPDRKSFILTFSIHEGQRYKVGSVDIKSNIAGLNPDFLNKVVTIHTGDWYKMDEIERSVIKMTDSLGNHQFAFVDIQPGVVPDRQTHTVAITFTINEGQKTFVHDINISGNTRTEDSVIRRQMLLVEGDPFNKSKLKESETRIKNLGFFGNVKVKAVPGTAPNETNVDVNVTEKSTGELSLGGGYSTTDGPLADFTIKENNFLGTGRQVSLSAMLAAKMTQFDFSYTDPYFMDRNMTAGIDLFNVTQDLQIQSSYNYSKAGMGLRFGYPLSERLRQDLGLRWEADNVSGIAPNASIYIQEQAGRYTTAAISQTLTYDARDSKIEPTSGFITHFMTEVAVPGGNARYYKFDTGGTYYYPIAHQWVLSFLGDAGYVHGWGGKTVRINERFFLGGDTLRGFADAGVGPRDFASEDSLGGNKYYRGTVQLQFPTGLPPDLGVTAHAFTDFGSLWSLNETGSGIQNSSSPRVSVGVGFSWQSPMGPMSIDFARPIKKESYDKVQQFRFSFGTRF